MSYRLKWESTGVIKKFTEVVNDEEFIAATEGVQNHPDFSDIWFVINDFSEVNSFEVTPQIMDSYFSRVANAYRTNDKIKIAFITQDSVIEQHVNTYVRTSRLPYRSRVFASMGEARSWCKGLKFKST